MDFLENLFEGFRFFDAVDIALVSFAVYRVLLMIKGTRAVQMLTGLVMLVFLHIVATTVEMPVITSVMTNLWDNLAIIVVVLFQNDIRRFLSEMGGQRLVLSTADSFEEGHVFEELIRTSVSLANKKIGALIVIEGEADLADHIEEGIALDARVSKEAITTIFMPVSPIHDGAIIISKGRIAKARCFLPLTLNPNVVKSLGTRHRAAVGLTEETDAICIVVSEEDGTISVVADGRIVRDLDAISLRRTLQQLIQRGKQRKTAGSGGT